MSAHTPGPWAVGTLPIINGKYAGCYAIKPQAGPPFAVMIGNGPADLREANAALIAAAPDLLEAISCIVLNARLQPDSHMAGTTDCYAIPTEDIEAARAVIAKATGRK